MMRPSGVSKQKEENNAQNNVTGEKIIVYRALRK